MVKTYDAIVRGLAAELVTEETAMIVADQAVSVATTKFEVASRKYASIRDMVEDRLGHSPYSDRTTALWPETKYPLGLYRYIYMKPGDAILSVLAEADRPLDLDDIIMKLEQGNIRLPSSTLARATNAALMKTTGIEKTQEGKYQLQTDVDDLPF